jgi:membrane dipeptidase
MNDRMIRDLAAHGGVMQVNYHVGYLSQAYTTAVKANDGRIDKAIDAEAAEKCGEDEACLTIAGGDFARKRVEAGTLPRVDWTQIVDHIDHAAKVAGADHVGLGSDFDGAQMPYGMEDVASLPKLTKALLERGYTPEQVRGILGGNLLRVMERVEAVAAGR